MVRVAPHLFVLVVQTSALSRRLRPMFSCFSDDPDSEYCANSFSPCSYYVMSRNSCCFIGYSAIKISVLSSNKWNKSRMVKTLRIFIKVPLAKCLFCSCYIFIPCSSQFGSITLQIKWYIKYLCHIPSAVSVFLTFPSATSFIFLLFSSAFQSLLAYFWYPRLLVCPPPVFDPGVLISNV